MAHYKNRAEYCLADKAQTGTIPSKQWNNNIEIDESKIQANLLEISNNIAPCKPKIIGVTKYYGCNAIISAYKAGLRDFAESRTNDGIEKINSLSEEIRKNCTFHFIGHLQSNKAAKTVKSFDCIQSVDSLELASRISDEALKLGKVMEILLQVNVAQEEQKFGYTKEQIAKDFPEIIKLKGINLKGLMCMAPLGAPETELTKVFQGLKSLRDELSEEYNIPLDDLSMGMSDDYTIAVQQGATMIRIGRKLFS